MGLFILFLIRKDYQLSIFEPTVPMSTYLVAFVVADFVCEKAIANAGYEGSTLVQICAKPTSSGQLSYVLDMAKRLLEQYERIYNVPYPLPKIGKF